MAANKRRSRSDVSRTGLSVRGKEAESASASSLERSFASESVPLEPVVSKSRHHEVGIDEDGQRIDNFLLRRCPGVPRSHVYRLIRTGEVRVDGKKIKQTRKLKKGELVRVPAIRIKPPEQVHVPDKLCSAIGESVILEHADFLVLNKPAGIAVHGGSGLAFGLIDALRQYRDEPRLELAHRLDRATSGCLLIGRSLRATRELQNLFRQRVIAKRYLALVAGTWSKQCVTIDVPLLKNVEQAGERRVVVDPAGQEAVTHFFILQRFSQATLLDVALETGRTHQIRVHTRYAGHAIVGDLRYGDNASNARFKKQGLNRLFLHSASLEFQWAGDTVRIEASPGTAWANALSVL